MKVVIHMDKIWDYSLERVPDTDSARQFLSVSDEDWADYQRVREEWDKWQDRLSGANETFKL